MTRLPFRIATAWLIVALPIAAGCGKPTAEEVETESVVPVTTAPAARGPIIGVVHATGIVKPAPGAELVVVAPEAARIAAIPHAAGDRVRNGDVLVRFDIPSAAAEVQRQEADVARSRAAVESARATLTRARELFDRGVGARREVEDATRALADAQASLAQASASRRAAESLAGRTVVRATFDGIVAARQHNPGDLVEPSASDPVLRVIDPRRLEIVASVPANDATRVDRGRPAHVVNVPTGTAVPGLEVISRPAAIEPGTGTLPVRLAFRSAPDLPADLPVQVDIEAERHANAVVVPSAAIVREGGTTLVFVVQNGKARRRQVEVGIDNGAQAEIVGGLAPGEPVIVDGQAGLPDGAAVSAKPMPANGPAAPSTDDAPSQTDTSARSDGR